MRVFSSVASRHCVPILADEIYSDMVSVTREAATSKAGSIDGQEWGVGGVGQQGASIRCEAW